MAGFIQPGDVINFAKLAWDIYRYGWSDDLSATTQYREFFGDVKGLANNLDLLTRVVDGATFKLQRQGARDAMVRWDRASLGQIIGDYTATLEECHQLIAANKRYCIGSNPMRNIEWNVLVQPRADQLRQRIALHNAKVLQVLKPFEIDLLSRVQQDIRNMHEDLADRITAVHEDLQRMMGEVVPNLAQELRQRSQRQTYLIEVPIDVAERFRMAALKDRPEYNTDAEFKLEELSDAFVSNFEKGTVQFSHGMTISQRTPPIDQYVNLLKCVWIFKRIQLQAQGQLMDQESHWPSFIYQLEETLSIQCSRFRQDLVEPRVNASQMRGDYFSVFPERDPIPLLDVVTRNEMMEQLLVMPLQGNGSTVERNLKLLRRMGSDGRRYRIIISGTEQTMSSRPRRQTEVIDFDITSVFINPLYAMPNSGGAVQEMILTRDERIARVAFTKMSHILKLQQALTGFKPYDAYFQFNCLVSFVVVGQKVPLCESASLQLWVPKEVGGTLVTTSDVAADGPQVTSPSRTSSFAMSENTPGLPPLGRDTFSNPFRRSGDRLSSSPPHQPSLPTIPQRQATSPGMFQTPWPRQTSPTPMGTTPPDMQGYYTGSPLQSPGRRPVGQSPSPRRSSTHASTAWSATNGRSSSISSAVSTSAVSTSAVSVTSNSSSSDGRTTISRGSNVTAYLHRKPPKPMLVLFTQNPQTKRTSFVTIQIDEETSVNPDRCNCRRSGRDGMSCRIAAIEKRKGNSHLDAKRFESTDMHDNQGSGWNLARLALNNPTSTNSDFAFKKLNRISIMFPDPMDRARFCGTPHQCQCKAIDQGTLAACLNAGHRGLWGKVQEIYRREHNAYYQMTFGAQNQVVNGVMLD